MVAEPIMRLRVGSAWTASIRSVGGAAAQPIARNCAVPDGTVSAACPMFPQTLSMVATVSQSHRNLRSERRVETVAWCSAASISRRVRVLMEVSVLALERVSLVT
ncbi:Uncharacterised protein [Mycobacteroides abscessus subsp. abscessus]|nr:Uncharacterised protein [Mycobacteroides abscessus subsp. abscessus]SHT56129.1 Uncharacterised protein [Mycobacteroides abscessus subsp. abscessus]SKK64700.1 Uncharacterised protein [Mycobacteroides abscessus subsp. abscessus]